jgi:signal transduction histidine kinase
MADRSPSLRRRFAVWFGLLFVLGAMLFRLAHYRTTVDTLARDFDVQLWSRLAAVKAQERFAPDTLLDPHVRTEGIFLPSLPAQSDWVVPRALGWAVPRLEPSVDAPFTWFAGVWKRDGTLVDALDLPAGFTFDAAWSRLVDTLWTTPDGAHRLAATAGAHDTLVIAGTPLAGLVDATRRAAWHQVLTFAVWVPIVLGTAWVLLSSVLAPAARLAAIARRIRAGHFGERIDVRRTDAEFVEAAHALNAMLDRFDAIRESQARFNADVAHQLLNPVHAILLETEAAGHGGDAAARLRRIDDLGHRIEALCETLLTYSRSAAIDEARLVPVDLEPIVAAAIDRTAPAATRLGREGGCSAARGGVREPPRERAGAQPHGRPDRHHDRPRRRRLPRGDHRPRPGCATGRRAGPLRAVSLGQGGGWPRHRPGPVANHRPQPRR